MKLIGLFRNENVLIPEPIEDEFSIQFDVNYTTLKIYGWMLRADYPKAGGDRYFGINMGSGSLIPRMSSSYNNGVYSDYSSCLHSGSFVDRGIKTGSYPLPTMEYGGYTWYYYYFTCSDGYYFQVMDLPQEDITYSQTYMRFIIKPQND